MLFSIRLGWSILGSLNWTWAAAELVCGLWIVKPEIGLLLGLSEGSECGTLLQKQERRWVSGGFARDRSNAKVSSSLREKIDCLEGECFCIPFTEGVAWYL